MRWPVCHLGFYPLNAGGMIRWIAAAVLAVISIVRIRGHGVDPTDFGMRYQYQRIPQFPAYTELSGHLVR